MSHIPSQNSVASGMRNACSVPDPRSCVALRQRRWNALDPASRSTLPPTSISKAFRRTINHTHQLITSSMRLACIFVALVATSLHASGPAVYSKTDEDAALSNTEWLREGPPSDHANGRHHNLRENEDRGISEDEARGFLSWIKSCLPGVKKYEPRLEAPRDIHIRIKRERRSYD